MGLLPSLLLDVIDRHDLATGLKGIVITAEPVGFPISILAHRRIMEDYKTIIKSDDCMMTYRYLS